MKTEEFIKKLEEGLGYVAEESGRYITIKKEIRGYDKFFATVAIDVVLDIDTTFYSFRNLVEREKVSLFNLILDYAATPLEYREVTP